MSSVEVYVRADTTLPVPPNFLLRHLRRFYANATHWEIAKNINTTFAGRLIEFLLTTYSKHYRAETTFVRIRKYDNVPEAFPIHAKYQTMLKEYNKANADPFQRGTPVTFVHPTDASRVLETTIAQANLYRWLIENDVYTYLEQNCAHIRAAMQHYSHEKTLDNYTNPHKPDVYYVAQKLEFVFS